MGSLSFWCPWSYRNMSLNLCVVTLLSDWKTQIFTLQFVTVAKLQLWSSNNNNFMIGFHHHTKNCTKGSQHWEALRSSPLGSLLSPPPVCVQGRSGGLQTSHLCPTSSNFDQKQNAFLQILNPPSFKVTPTLTQKSQVHSVLRDVRGVLNCEVF